MTAATDGAPVLTWHPLGDRAMTLRLFGRPDEDLQARVLGLYRRIEAARAEAALDGLIDVVPALGSMTLHFDPRRLPHPRLRSVVEAMAADRPTAQGGGRAWSVPVRYGGEHGPDLEEVAAIVGLQPAAVIATHTATPHTVAMLGFLPGFAYLTGTPAVLHLPRRSPPRVRVPARSLAIAAGLCGIYPWDSPGGWHLLGRTPVPMFDPRSADRPIPFAPGDVVRFRAIDDAEYAALAEEVAGGVSDWRVLRPEAAP